MSKARDFADIAGAVSGGKIASTDVNVSFENITDTGTEGTKVATGTTAQRGSTQGQIRFNTTTNLAEYYTGTAFKTIDSPPTVTSVNVSSVNSDAGGNQTVVVTGTNFQSGATVTFVGNAGTNFNAASVTIDSATQITAVAAKSSFLNAQEPYGVKVTNPSGLAATLASQINVNAAPTWSTSSGSLGSIAEGNSVNVSASATDADGDTITYSETGGSVLSTNNLTLNSSTGAITGTAGSVSSDTTLSFTLRATAGSDTADRAFSIIILNKNGTSSAAATDDLSEISYDHTDGTAHKKWVIVNGSAKNVYVKNHNDGWYWVLAHTFGGNNALTTTDSDVLIKAGVYYTTENMQNATTDKLRFSDNSNNYVTSAQGNSFWAMEGTANGYDSSYGSAQTYFKWWAHSGNLARLHVYGDLSSVVPSTVTHGLWRAYDNYATTGIIIKDSSDSTIFTSSGSGFTPTTARFSLGTLSGTGSHGSIRDGSGNTNDMYELWVGSQ